MDLQSLPEDKECPLRASENPRPSLSHQLPRGHMGCQFPSLPSAKLRGSGRLSPCALIICLREEVSRDDKAYVVFLLSARTQSLVL